VVRAEPGGAGRARRGATRCLTRRPPPRAGYFRLTTYRWLGAATHGAGSNGILTVTLHLP
ncbi:MAG: hypothetical protein KGK18_05715, partial [Burkholderiales bacterium]|nr:hypothetical protein [Burkholderiales bacterium]